MPEGTTQLSRCGMRDTSSKALRVALVGHCIGYNGGLTGGAERQTIYIARALAEAGVHVRIYVLDRNSRYDDSLRRLNVEVKYFGAMAGVPLRVLHLLARLQSFQPHIIQSLHTYTNVYSAIAGRVLRIISIGGLRSDLPSCLADNGRFSRFLLTWPDGVVANSRAAIRQIRDARLVDPRRLYHLSNVVDLERFGGSCEVPVDEDRPECVCICVTRLFPLKRVDVFLRALAVARATEPRLRGMVVGFGPEGERLRQLARDLEFSPEIVRFLGPREDVAALLRQAAMFVFCSESEGTPNVILEAMAAGRPIITTPAGDAAEVVTPAGAGYIVPFGDVNAIASAMVQLAQSPELRGSLGRAGRDYIARHLAPSELAGQLLKIYADVARTTARGRRSDLLERVAQCSERI